MEADTQRDPHDNNKRAIRRAFEEAGVRFTSEGCVCFPPQEE